MTRLRGASEALASPVSRVSEAYAVSVCERLSPREFRQAKLYSGVLMSFKTYKKDLNYAVGIMLDMLRYLLEQSISALDSGLNT